MIPSARTFLFHVSARVNQSSGGGFVVPRIPAGDYAMIVRRVGYEPIVDIRSAQAGVVDTLRLKLSEARVFLRGPKWRVASGSY